MRLLAIFAVHAGLVFAQAVTPPELVRRVEPEYPAAARAKNVEGVVSLYLEVNPKGVPENVKVVKSLGPEFDSRAIDAVRQWRFKPGVKAGVPVTISANVEVQFRAPHHPVLPGAPRPEETAPAETADPLLDWLDQLMATLTSGKQ